MAGNDPNSSGKHRAAGPTPPSGNHPMPPHLRPPSGQHPAQGQIPPPASGTHGLPPHLRPPSGQRPVPPMPRPSSGNNPLPPHLRPPSGQRPVPPLSGNRSVPPYANPSGRHNPSHMRHGAPPPLTPTGAKRFVHTMRQMFTAGDPNLPLTASGTQKFMHTIGRAFRPSGAHHGQHSFGQVMKEIFIIVLLIAFAFDAAMTIVHLLGFENMFGAKTVEYALLLWSKIQDFINA